MSASASCVPGASGSSRPRITVGTPIAERPRTAPYVPDSSIRLLPWVSDGKALVRSRMKDSGRRQPRISKFRHSLPCQVVLLTSTPKRSSPEIADIVAERAERPGIRRHSVVCEEPRDHCPQPSALFGDGVVHAATQFLLDLAKLRPHAVAPALALELEGSASRPAANEREPQEAKGA